MSIDRAEQTGVGVALAGHLLLFAILYVGFAATPPLTPPRQAVEVQLVDEVGLESGAPVISPAPPAPKLGEIEGPIEPAPPEPAPQPVQRQAPPQPKATPQPKAAPPQPKSAPKQQATRSTGRLKGLLEGIGERDSSSQSTTPAAASITPAVQNSLAAEVRRQLKPHWRAPSGADVEQLATVLEVRLARDGSIIGEPQVVDQTGINASNRSQAGLHRENAIRAVRLAAPFNLPGEYYDAWKVIRPRFDRRL